MKEGLKFFVFFKVLILSFGSLGAVFLRFQASVMLLVSSLVWSGFTSSLGFWRLVSSWDP